MQFKVPQFLDIEDKIFGPFTFREFAYLAGGGGMCFVIYKIMGLFWGAIPILLVAGFALALTFYKPNNKPFVYMLESAFKYALQSKLYIWKRRKFSYQQSVKKAEEDRAEAQSSTRGVKLSGSKLRDLAWSLDVLDIKKLEK